MDIKKMLTQLCEANSKDQWICSDLSVPHSTYLGRVFWKLFAKHFNWTRRVFYNIDLETSKKTLNDLRIKVEHDEKLYPLYCKAVAVFNSIAPHHVVTSATGLVVELLNGNKPPVETLYYKTY